MTSSHELMAAPRKTGLIAIVAGAIATAVLGLLTFGVQATARPGGIPLAITVPVDGPAAAPLRAVAERVSGQGQHEVAWQITTPEQAAGLLNDKEVYGILELTLVPSRGVSAFVVVSGAINPSGTQVAQQALTAAAQAVSTATAHQAGAEPPPPIEVRTEHSRTAPLAASALLWIGTLVAALLITVPTLRGVRIEPRYRLAVAAGSAVTVAATVWGLLALWQTDLATDLRVPAFLLLVAVAFASLQAAVFRLVGIRGMAILALLYLMAPSVAGQVPEMLHGAYRVLLWSWTPFRFSTEALRSLFHLEGMPQDVWTATWVFGTLTAIALVVLLWPNRGRPVAPRPPADTAAPAMRT